MQIIFENQKKINEDKLVTNKYRIPPKKKEELKNKREINSQNKFIKKNSKLKNRKINMMDKINILINKFLIINFFIAFFCSIPLIIFYFFNLIVPYKYSKDIWHDFFWEYSDIIPNYFNFIFVYIFICSILYIFKYDR